MSTPSGKPFDQFDHSPYAPKRAREHSDRPPVENGGNHESEDVAAIARAYVPRAAIRSAAADRHPVDLDAGEAAQPGPEPDTRDEGVRDEIIAGKPAGDDAVDGGADLARLESSLRWLQREGAVGHLPRAVQLPPVPGLSRVDPQAPRPRAEQFINGVRVPPSLAPERLRPPPLRARGDNLRGPLRILLASVIAAPIAYYFSVGSLVSPPAPGRESGLASLASRLVAGGEFPIPQEKLRPSEAEEYNTVVSTRNKLVVQPTVSESPSSERAEIAAVLPVTPAPDQAPPAAKTIRELDPDSIRLLMQQGAQFVASGDLVAARLVYQRAAESGDAAAALALGATFDPAVLAKIGVRGMGADIAKARSWYEKAKEFGSPEAPRRLELLANR